MAFVLVGGLLVVLFSGVGGDRAPAAQPAGAVDADLLWVVSLVYGDEQGFEVEVAGRVAAYDAESGDVVYSIDAGQQVDAVLSPDGATLYVASIGESGDDIVAYDARTGAEQWRMVAQERVHYRLNYGPSSMAVSPDGSRLYVYSSNAPNVAWVQVFDTATRERVASIDSTYCAADMRLSPDGKTLYLLCQVAGVSQAVDLATEQPVVMDPVLPSSVAGTALAPDGRTLYAVGRQGMETEAVIIDLAERAVIERVGLDGNPAPEFPEGAVMPPEACLTGT